MTPFPPPPSPVGGDDRSRAMPAAAPDLDVAALTGELERISNDLMVDITLDETLRT
jgi:hypothetical protein